MDSFLLDKLKEITDEEREILEGKKPSTNIVYKHKILDDGKLIKIWPHTRFIHFPAHSHNYIEIVYMCQGCTHHIINNNEIILNKGELLFINLNALHEIYPADKDDIAINFIIQPEFFDIATKMMDEKDNSLFNYIIESLTNCEDNMGYFHFKVSEVLPIQNLIENLIWSAISNQDNTRDITQYTMGLLLLHLMNLSNKIFSENNYEQELTLKILKFVEDNYREGTLSKLAESLNCDMVWLSRTIKRLTDKTFTELIQIKRLNQAAYLLENTKIPIADIGYFVGYENLSYFYRIFKEHYGLTPRYYRLSKLKET
ncbi:AraC family transcriptional regulator [Herbinix luporum]|uniref:AraC family transcriptional regulator n=1 Tax=Herbinix luporum TaxID=1679721 RepID=UPI0017543B88|nr:AraC family transcriptional regulator [Herbinix luporum]MDI9487797.1 AraC family transcriptional regulator [Bacillota bacterium]HHT56198.1 helix-turn-helix transcriptional regulator [Herbinix luporum]